MKSLRLTSTALLLVAAVAAHAADAKKDSAKADKKASASATPAAKSSLPDPVAVVEGKDINKAEFEKEFAAALASAGKNPSDLTDQQKQQGYHAILDDMIIERLLQKRSADEKVTDEDVNKSFQQIRSQLSDEQLAAQLKKSGQTEDSLKTKIKASLKEQHWIESQIADKTAVSESDAKSFYDSNSEKFKVPETVRASHILFAVPEDAKPGVAEEKEKLAKSTEDRIKKGEDFAKLASELSDDPGSKSRGGDLDFFSHDRMVPEFADAAFKMKVGDVSDPVKTQYGYHIIKVTDKKEARTVPFPEAKERILAYLKESKKRQAVNELLTTMREKADVKVNLPPLQKPATPTAPAP